MIALDANQKMPKSFKSSIAPIVYFLDEKNQETEWETYGYKNAKDFLKNIKIAQEDSLL